MWLCDTDCGHPHSVHVITGGGGGGGGGVTEKSPNGQKPQRRTEAKSQSGQKPLSRKYFNTLTLKMYNPLSVHVITWSRCGQSPFCSCDHVGVQRKAPMDKSPKDKNQSGLKPQSRNYFNTLTLNTAWKVKLMTALYGKIVNGINTAIYGIL